MSQSDRSSQPGQQQQLDDPVELEHALGYSGKFADTIVHHPTESNIIIHDIGSVVVIADVDDP